MAEIVDSNGYQLQAGQLVRLGAGSHKRGLVLRVYVDVNHPKGVVDIDGYGSASGQRTLRAERVTVLRRSTESGRTLIDKAEWHDQGVKAAAGALVKPRKRKQR